MKAVASVSFVVLLFVASAQGNHPAERGEVPYLVSIWQVKESLTLVGNDTDFQCTGVLLTSTHVLTTVSCIEQSKDAFGAVVSAGFVDRSLSAPTPPQFHDIVEVVKHENYNDLTTENDLAMLTVSPGFEDEEFVYPVSLAPSKTLPGAQCVVAGWRLSFYYTSEELHVAEVEVLPDSDCLNVATMDSSVDEGRLTFAGEKLCVGNPSPEECIVGDEGGPLVCNGRLVGLFSSYGLICLDTSPEPNLYHDLDHYREWIELHSTGGNAGTFLANAALVFLLAGAAIFRR